MVSGVILYRYNIENPAQTRELIGAFKKAQAPFPLFVMLDQEGGKVQRINSAKGFSDTASAKRVAVEFSLQQAYDHYASLGQELSKLGFNFDFAPCIDLDSTPTCEVIGALERSYGSDSNIVSQCAEQMINGLSEHGVISCAKHFPGHGSASGDSHLGLVDITSTWNERELEPYQMLQSRGLLDVVMSAHLVHQGIDSDTPITFSARWIEKLRTEVGFDGVVVTDDLHMGALVYNYSFDDICVRPLLAGHDLLIFSNNPLASQHQGIRHDEKSGVQTWADSLTVPDENIAEHAFRSLRRALDENIINEKNIERSIQRIIDLKQRFKLGQ
jgi:beta-N-acetylhexosaminidase